MNTVIQLSEKRDRRPKAEVPLGVSAEIVIFPGVRVERLTEEPRKSPRRLPALRESAIAEELE